LHGAGSFSSGWSKSSGPGNRTDYRFARDCWKFLNHDLMRTLYESQMVGHWTTYFFQVCGYQISNRLAPGGFSAAIQRIFKWPVNCADRAGRNRVYAKWGEAIAKAG
jgi:hypothetical protein